MDSDDLENKLFKPCPCVSPENKNKRMSATSPSPKKIKDGGEDNN
jgi:hypothetical protein